jgi:N-acetylglutamate synthase
MCVEDYPEVVALWRASQGVGLTESDSPAGVAAFLVRNPGMSAVACDAEGRVVGAVLCGHDGRSGIGRALVAHCFARLAELGILRCNIFLYPDNAEGEAFWRHAGWIRPEWFVMQKPVAPEE